MEQNPGVLVQFARDSSFKINVAIVVFIILMWDTAAYNAAIAYLSLLHLFWKI